MAHDTNDQAGKTIMTLWNEHFSASQPETNQEATNYKKYTTTTQSRSDYNNQYNDFTAVSRFSDLLSELGEENRGRFPNQSIKASTPSYTQFFADQERFRTQTESAYTEVTENTGREFE